jgi:hypothetical protein
MVPIFTQALNSGQAGSMWEHRGSSTPLSTPCLLYRYIKRKLFVVLFEKIRSRFGIGQESLIRVPQQHRFRIYLKVLSGLSNWGFEAEAESIEKHEQSRLYLPVRDFGFGLWSHSARCGKLEARQGFLF